MVGVKYLDSLTPHKLTALAIIAISVWLIVHNTGWYLAGKTSKPFVMSILFHGVFLIPYILCYLFENKFTRYVLVFSISAVAILSAVTFSANYFSFLFIVVSVLLILAYKLDKTIIFVLLGVQIISASVGEYLVAGTVQPIINIIAMTAVIIPFIYKIFEKVVDWRIKPVKEKYEKEVALRDKIIVETQKKIDDIVRKVQ